MTGPMRRPSRRDFLRRALGTLVAGPAAAKALIEAPAIAPTPTPAIAPTPTPAIAPTPTPTPAAIRWQYTNEIWNFDTLALETYTNFQPYLPSNEYVSEFLSTMKHYLNNGKSTIPEPDAVLPFAVGGEVD